VPEKFRQTGQVREMGQPVPESKSGLSAQAASPLGRVPLHQGLAGLIASLKLPQDSLSRSIVAFSRFFSLPLRPNLMGSLRKEALGHPVVIREAAALVAAAVTDKGLKLNAGALGEYAAALEGCGQEMEWAGERIHGAGAETGKDGRNGEPGGETGGSGGHSGTGSHDASGGSREKDGTYRKTTADTISPEEIQRQVLQVLRERPLLDLINRMPGKDGRRWVVIPLVFCRAGIEFAVSLRLLYRAPMSPVTPEPDPECLSVDIRVRPAGSGGSEEKQKKGGRRWLITMERDGKVSLSLYSAAGMSLEGLGESLAADLGLSAARVTVREEVLLFADSREDPLRTVYEEV
jgi:hypothetical protein